jgi:hypothetical protein
MIKCIMIPWDQTPNIGSISGNPVDVEERQCYGAKVGVLLMALSITGIVSRARS